MMHLLEIEIAPADTEELRGFDRIAMVDVQPPYFGDRMPRADIVIDHHPGYAARQRRRSRTCAPATAPPPRS